MVTEIVRDEHPQRSFTVARLRLANLIAGRAARGRDLYLGKRQLIVKTGEDTHRVPSSSGEGRYTVHYGAGREDCECTDFQINGTEVACKHLTAVALLYATRRSPSGIRIRQVPPAGDPFFARGLAGRGEELS